MMIADELAQESSLPRRVEHGQPNIAAVRTRVTDLEQQARTWIRQRPVVAVLAAAGAGYLAARIVSRVIR